MDDGGKIDVTHRLFPWTPTVFGNGSDIDYLDYSVLSAEYRDEPLDCQVSQCIALVLNQT